MVVLAVMMWIMDLWVVILCSLVGGSSITLVIIYETTWHHPEDLESNMRGFQV